MNGILARFQSISEKDKSALVRKLMENSTPNFDFFYLTGLSIIMATLGLLLDNTAIIIGSMLIAPLMYPILGVALGLVMSNGEVLGRSIGTLIKALVIGFVLAIGAAFSLVNRTCTKRLRFLVVFSQRIYIFL